MKIVSAAAVVVVAGSAGAQVWPNVDGAMKHVHITFDGTNVGVEIDFMINPEPTPLPMMNHGLSHTAPADVLDGKYVSSQYGFLADGFINLPQGSAIWIEMTSATAGLDIYEGGMRNMRPMHTYAPIFGTGGSSSAWKWNGMMHHPWVAAPSLGAFDATFNVYLGDETTGAPLSGFGMDSVTLDWNAIPAPGSAVVLVMGGIACARRRR
ncbi:MAG: hypothetical protein COB69_10225 [Phycisphaera sp.]|nr:MAG: hypothetical protein COB69_10225 [Phycisphaera sp.]